MVWCVSLHSDLQRINESISCCLCSLSSLWSSVKCKMWVCGSDCSLLSSTLTFDLVFSHSITAVTNTTDAAQVPQPLKVQSFHETLVYWVTSTPFKLLSNITALTKFVLIAHFVSSLHTREGPCSCSMWLYPVPHVTRQRCPVVLWNPPREGRGDGIQLLFGPECDQGAALSGSAAKWTNNWPPHALWLWNLQGPTYICVFCSE